MNIKLENCPCGKNSPGESRFRKQCKITHASSNNAAPAECMMANERAGASAIFKGKPEKIKREEKHFILSLHLVSKVSIFFSKHSF